MLELYPAVVQHETREHNHGREEEEQEEEIEVTDTSASLVLGPRFLSFVFREAPHTVLRGSGWTDVRPLSFCGSVRGADVARHHA